MLISGQTMVVKTLGGAADEDALKPAAMTSVSLGSAGTTDQAGKSPGTRSKAMAMLRAELLKAQEYARKLALPDETKRPARNLRMEAMLRALDGTQPLLITAHRQQDIMSALRLAAEFDLSIVLDGCSDAPMVLDEIKAAGFPVLLHPTMARSFGDLENLSMETAAKLRAAGVPFAIQSGYESYVPKTRVVLFEAAVAAGKGLGFEGALVAVTLEAARILGMANQIGSLEVGKDADLALYDGDPFEYTTRCLAVFINGREFPGEQHAP
jgi:imidazolonepropionase-like amidohydrolase